MNAPDAVTGDAEQKPLRILVDMDGVLCGDPPSALIDEHVKLCAAHGFTWNGHWSDIPYSFRHLLPIPGAVDGFCALFDRFDVFVVSTAPWGNDEAWTDKLRWVKQHIPRDMKGRLILTHRKDLVACDWIIDDRKKNGVENMGEKHVHFGQPPFENWGKVVAFFADKA